MSSKEKKGVGSWLVRPPFLAGKGKALQGPEKGFLTIASQGRTTRKAQENLWKRLRNALRRNPRKKGGLAGEGEEGIGAQKHLDVVEAQERDPD